MAIDAARVEALYKQFGPAILRAPACPFGAMWGPSRSWPDSATRRRTSRTPIAPARGRATGDAASTRRQLDASPTAAAPWAWRRGAPAALSCARCARAGAPRANAPTAPTTIVTASSTSTSARSSPRSSRIAQIEYRL